MPDSQKTEMLKVAVSSCLMGSAVRYDGQHKRQTRIVEMFDEHFEAVVVCPEMLAGLGTPRPPVQLVRVGNQIQARGVQDKELDVTKLIEKVVAEFIAVHTELSGMILQSRSPSCGVGSTPLFDECSETIGFTNGLFADAIVNAFPGMPIQEDDWFVDQGAVDKFVEQVRSYARTETN